VLSVGSRGALKRRVQFRCSEGERVPRISVWSCIVWEDDGCHENWSWLGVGALGTGL